MKTYSVVDYLNNFITVDVMPDVGEVRLTYGRKVYIWDADTAVLKSVNLVPFNVENHRA